MNTALKKVSLFDKPSRDFPFFDDIGRLLFLHKKMMRPFESLTEDVNFPKYNTVETDTGIDIEIALAGYKKDDIKIELSPDGVLTISANVEKTSDYSDRKYISHGIAERNFSISYGVGTNHKIGDITFENGLLVIPIKEMKPKPPENKLLEIK